jgi:hypothetical protein
MIIQGGERRRGASTGSGSPHGHGREGFDELGALHGCGGEGLRRARGRRMAAAARGFDELGAPNGDFREALR